MMAMGCRLAGGSPPTQFSQRCWPPLASFGPPRTIFAVTSCHDHAIGLAIAAVLVVPKPDALMTYGSHWLDVLSSMGAPR
jgi:hypothetical protein